MPDTNRRAEQDETIGARRLATRIACAAALAMALAACGSSGKSTTTTKTTLKPGSTTTTTRVGATGAATTTAATLAPVTTVAVTLPPATTAAATPTSVAFKAESTTGSLSKGVKGTRTAAMQTKLRALAYDAGPSDGLFGDKTEAAVKRFQSDQKLQVDGIAGSVTLSALDKACKAKNVC